jgi:hypothetical protein
MKNTKRIYIAGPITKGMWDENIGKAIEVYHELLDLGFAPYLPHLNFFCALTRRRVKNDWMRQDLVWLKLCNAVLRLPGESEGADLECQIANARGIPVFTSIKKLNQVKEAL